jgi:uncharacterized protein (DUF305 family)
MFNRKSIVYAFVIAALLGVAAFGITNSRALAQTTPTPTPAAEPHSMTHAMTETVVPFDAQFIDGMIVHHEGAVVMAEEALVNSEQPEVRALAEAIIAAQGPEIEQMQAWRGEWYPDLAATPGMDMSMGDMAVSSDESIPNDQRFLVAMISHHQGAIHMAEEALEKAEHPELKTLAEAIIAAQQAEIAQMSGWLEEWYGVVADEHAAHGPAAESTDHEMHDMNGMQMGQMQMDHKQMGKMMVMMGQMMQMMGSQMMADDGHGMMDDTAPMTETMPMTGTMPMGGQQMQMDQMQMMDQMMDQMMEMMGQMHGMMMGGQGMAQPESMSKRQAEVAQRGAEVMPFDLEQTQHIFTKTENGGVQQVVIQEGADADQVSAIQTHLSEIAEKFSSGDFGGPAHIHGDDMPGLAVLHERFGEVEIVYTALDNGGQIEYTSDEPALVEAIHAWFDAQMAGHGPHAGH